MWAVSASVHLLMLPHRTIKQAPEKKDLDVINAPIILEESGEHSYSLKRLACPPQRSVSSERQK